MSNKHEHGGENPWWEKLTDASSDTSKGKSLIMKALIVAIVAMAGILIWQYIQKTSKGGNDELSMALFEAGSFLPDFEDTNFGLIPDLEPNQNVRVPQTLASNFYRRHEPDVAGRNNTLAAYTNTELAASYVTNAERAIADLEDVRGKFKEATWELKYLHTLQQLHFYCSLNCVDPAQRIAHLNKQKAVLAELESKHAGKGLMGLKPYEKSEMTILDLWKQSNEEEIKAYEELALKGKIEVVPDSQVVVTIELENGKTLKMKTYSEVATKSVQNFLDHVRSGLYDGIAVHRVDQGAGVVELGSPFTRLAADRKFLWGREVPGYTVPPEGSPLLPVKRGSVTTKSLGTAGHGLFFEIHVAEPDRVSNIDTVIGEITEGLEALEAWLQTEVHDEVGVADRMLPRTRLGVKSIKVEGEVDFKGEDSWKPIMSELKVPEATAIEKQFEEAIQATQPKDETENKDGENKPTEESQDK